MNTKRIWTIGLAAATAFSVAGVTAATATGAIGAGATSSTTVAVTTVLTAQQQQDLIFSRDEERMARDLYTLLGAKYGSAVFTRISTSEARHYQAIGAQLARFGLADPSKGRAAGSYANADIQRLYDQWKAQGLTSLTAAYEVGVALEQRDIADLDRMITRTTDASLKRTYTMLRTASQQHLAAFTAAKNGDVGAGTCTGDQARTGSGPRAGMGAGMGAGAGMERGAGRGMGQRLAATS